MRRRLLRPTLVLAVTGAVLVAGSPAALAGGDHGHHGHDVQTVHVTGSGSSVSIDDARVHAGRVRFEVSTTGQFSAVTLFELENGATLHRFFDDVRDEFNPGDATIRAQGTRDARRDARFYGLADVMPGVPLTVTVNLRPGTYWLFDLTQPPDANQDPPVTRLRVTDGHAGGHSPDADVRVRMTGDRFLAPSEWPRQGTWSLRNADDTVHFMQLQPVQPGTTDGQVQAALEAGGTVGDLADRSRPVVGSEVLSPGIRHTVDYDLPAGTYVLLCFIADEADGMPHAVMGMHKVITLS